MNGSMCADAEFHVRAADVDDQDVPRGTQARAFPFCSHRAILPGFRDLDHRTLRTRCVIQTSGAAAASNWTNAAYGGSA
jgi:hypothetical protein